MQIVIIGIGKIGYILSSQLCQEGHDIVLVDQNLSVLQNAQNKLDVAYVAGNGASAEVQREAGVPGADLVIAVTSSDEVNILCSMVAHKLGCRSIITRVRNPEYDRQMSLLDAAVGITFTFNPEKSTANDIFHLLQFPAFLKRDSFAAGKVDMVELCLSPESELVGKKLSQLDEIIKWKAIVCAVEKGEGAVIPSGNFVLEANDRLMIAASPRELTRIAKAFGMPTVHIKKVMLIGGSNIAVYLAQLLVENHIEVKLIEENRERCEFLANLLPAVTVINGNGTEHDLLMDEGIDRCDAVVSLTGVDEENFLISMFAKHLGVPKTITKNNRIEYSDMFRGTGIDSIISPKHLAANRILRYVRAATASSESGVETLYRILDGKAEALGFTVPADSEFINIPLGKLRFRSNTLVAIILRDQNIIIPRGGDVIMPGDSIIVVTKPEYAVSDFQELFVNTEGGTR